MSFQDSISFPNDMFAQVGKYLESRDVNALKCVSPKMSTRIKDAVDDKIHQKIAPVDPQKVTKDLLQLNGTFAGSIGVFLHKQRYKIVPFSPPKQARCWYELMIMNRPPATAMEHLKKKIWGIQNNQTFMDIMSDLPLGLHVSSIIAGLVTGEYAMTFGFIAVVLVCGFVAAKVLSSTIHQQIFEKKLLERKDDELLVLVPEDFNWFRPEDFNDRPFHVLDLRDRNVIAGRLRLTKEVEYQHSHKTITGAQFFALHYYQKPGSDFGNDTMKATFKVWSEEYGKKKSHVT